MEKIKAENGTSLHSSQLEPNFSSVYQIYWMETDY